MNNVLDFLKEHKYLMVALVLVGISIVLSITYSNYIVTSNNHKAAEMYIGELKYSIEIDETTTNTLSVPTGETIIDVKVNNQNPVDTYYKLLYLKNSNLTVKYYETTKDTDEVVTTYSKPNDSIAGSNSNNIKLLITNNSTSSQNVAFTMKGGYITNTIQDITTPSTYSEITLVETPSTNTYFCTTTDTLTQGLKYVNGQYTYAYKQEGSSASSGWSNISNNGWGVQLTDKKSTNAVTSKVCTYINNKPIVSMYYMFYKSPATTLDVSNFNTSNVTNMYGMFAFSQATTLDVSNFDTSKVTNMSSMFSYSPATTLDVSNFDTSKVTNMSGMFYNSKATTLDVSNFNTSKVTNMSSMFYNSKATTLDVSNFDTSKVTNMMNMFQGSSNLKTIYGSSKFVTTAVTNSTDMFLSSTNLVGGSGTKYNSSHIDKTYARIDGGTSNPGYFTDITDVPNSFSTDSWKTIIKAVKNNNISKYNVGDTKAIDMGSYGTHTLRVANMSTPSECSTSRFSQTACGFVLEFADIITTHTMNDTDTNVGGWPATSMRIFVNNDIYNLLPSDLKNGIIDTTVVSSYGSEDSSNFTSTDKLYLLSPTEIWSDWKSNSGSNYDTARDVTRQLDYYKNEGVTTSNYSKAIKFYNSTDDWWWLRSARSIVDYSFYNVYYYGGWSYDSATDTYGVAPAFRLG